MGCALAVARHNGWAWFVTVAFRNARDGEDEGVEGFEVVDRRRVELIHPELPRQPYHEETLRVSAEAAERLLSEVYASVRHLSRMAVGEVLADLPDVGVVAIDGPPRRPVPEDLQAILGSHQMVHTADGELYRAVLIEAAREAGLAIFEVPRGKAMATAGAALQLPSADLEAMTATLGKPLGAPWRKEHREATAGAIAALTEIGV